MSDLLALAERVEAASEGSFKLDDAIYEALFCDGSPAQPFLHYTRSLDAAITLVPEGIFEEINSGGGTRRCFAQLVYPKLSPYPYATHVKRRTPSIYVVAATQTLAISAAALRARAASTPSLNAEIAGMNQGDSA